MISSYDRDMYQDMGFKLELKKTLNLKVVSKKAIAVYCSNWFTNCVGIAGVVITAIIL